jgi:hypothetical protein
MNIHPLFPPSSGPSPFDPEESDVLIAQGTWTGQISVDSQLPLCA